MSVVSLSNGVRPVLNSGGVSLPHQLGYAYGASNWPSHSGVASLFSTAWGPNSVNLQNAQVPAGARPGVWYAGLKDLTDIPQTEFGWQYVSPMITRTSGPLVGTVCGGPALTLAARIADAGRLFALHENGIGSTTLGGSYLGAIGTASNTRLISKAAAFGAPLSLRAAFGLIGGNDAENATYTADFEANMTTWDTTLRGLPLTGAPDLIHIWGNLHPAIVASLPPGRGDAINAAGAAWAAADPARRKVLDIGALFPGTPTYVVGVHYLTPALELIGDAQGALYLANVPP